MEERFPKEKIVLFDQLIVSLSTIIKNISLYPANHPLVDSSVRLFKSCADKWLSGSNKLDMGFSEDNILIDGKPVKEKSALYRDMADYMHQRGVIALSITGGITHEELLEFFGFIKNDAKALAGKGGIAKNIAKNPHLVIKEVDYSLLLKAGKSDGSFEEEIWKTLCDVGDSARSGELPTSKAEFINSFLGDTARSASALNRIYKQALAKVGGREATGDIRQAFARIVKYFEDNKAEEAKDARKGMADMVTKLDPALVVSLFEKTNIDGKPCDLSEEMLKGFTDDMMADFITSMVSNEGKMSDNMVNLFSRLVSGGARDESVATMVVDKLFESKLLDKSVISDLKGSIKEMFGAYPDNKFMSHVYKLTVDTYAGKEGESAPGAGRCQGIVKEYMEYLNEENLKRERARLLCNIAWHEDDPAKFKQFSEAILVIYKDILHPQFVKTLREIFELFTEKLRPKQVNNAEISGEIKRALGLLADKDPVKRIISFIPGLALEGMDDISYVLVKSSRQSAGMLLDLFVAENDSQIQNKYRYALSGMDKSITKEVSYRIEVMAKQGALGTVKDLFGMLKAINPDETRLMAKNIMKNDNADMRMFALDEYAPETGEEKESLYGLFMKEKKRPSRQKLLRALVKTGDGDILGKLFNSLKSGFFKKGELLELVKLCGDMKTLGSLVYLKKVLSGGSFFGGSEPDQVKVAAVVSLRQIGVPEAIEEIARHLTDKNEPVRRMCTFAIELLDKDKDAQAQDRGRT